MSELKAGVITVLIAILFIAGFIWLVSNAPNTVVTHHDLGDRGTYMCIEDWGWRKTEYVRKCFEFERLR